MTTSVKLKDIVGRMIRTEARVEFTDCDPYGHMASSRYLEMAVNHRMSAVTEQLGFDTLKTVKETGIAFVNKEVNLKYRSPAQFDDWITVESWVDEIQEFQLVVKVRLTNRDTGKIVCRVRIYTVTFDMKDGAAVPIPDTYQVDQPIDPHSLPWAPGHPKRRSE